MPKTVPPWFKEAIQAVVRTRGTNPRYEPVVRRGGTKRWYELVRRGRPTGAGHVNEVQVADSVAVGVQLCTPADVSGLVAKPSGIIFWNVRGNPRRKLPELSVPNDVMQRDCPFRWSN